VRETLVSEKLYIASRRSVLEHRINERLIYFSCWINGNINAEYLPPFTPSPPSPARQIQRRLMMQRERACVSNWTSHWNRSIPFVPAEMRLDGPPGARSMMVQTSAVSMQSFCGILHEVVILPVDFQQGKKGPSTSLLHASLVRWCWSMPYYGQQPEVRASHTLFFWQHLNVPCIGVCHCRTCCCKAIGRAAVFMLGSAVFMLG